MKALAPLFAIVGIAMLGFASHIALRGAEPEVPAEGTALEGTIVNESTVRGPAGAVDRQLRVELGRRDAVEFGRDGVSHLHDGGGLQRRGHGDG